MNDGNGTMNNGNGMYGAEHPGGVPDPGALFQALRAGLPPEIGLRQLGREAVLVGAEPRADYPEGAAFAAVIDGGCSSSAQVLREAFVAPEALGLPEAVDGAALIVVDPADRPQSEALYRRMGCRVVAESGSAVAEVLALAGGVSAGEVPEEPSETEVRPDAAAEPPAAPEPETPAAGRAESPGVVGGARYESPAREEPALRPSEDSQERRQRIRSSLAGRWTGERALTGEQVEALEAEATLSPLKRLLRRLGPLRRLLGAPREADPFGGMAPRFRRISAADAELIGSSEFPGVCVCANNKGGTGKTFTSVNLAAALSRMCHPAGHTEGLRVLLVEQNFGNSDIRERVALAPGGVRGLVEYVRDLERCRQTDTEAPPIVDYTTPISGMESLDVLLIAGDGEEWRHSGKFTFEHLDLLYESAGDYYDLVVVDVQNGLPQQESMVADTLMFWLSVADVFYLILDRSTGVQQASEFVDGARWFLTAEAFREGVEEIEVPLVPIFNQWDPDRPQAALWEGAVPDIGGDYAIGSGGESLYFLPIPLSDQVPEFERERRQIALESPSFIKAFTTVGLDFLTRVKRTRVAEHGPPAAPDTLERPPLGGPGVAAGAGAYRHGETGMSG